MNKNKIVLIGLAGIFIASMARADFNPVPLTPGSFNLDIVVESNAPKLLPYCITATTGSGTSEGDNTLFEQGWYAPAGQTGQYVGVPKHNTTFIDINNTNVQFLMPPTYLTNNTLQIDSTTTSGTFIVTTPTPATSLAILSGGSGTLTVGYSVTYSSGAPDTGTINLSDWFTPAGVQIAWGCNGRVTSTGGLSLYSTGTNTSNPYMYAYYVNLANTNPIISVTFSYGSGTHEGNFFAISGANGGSKYTPIPVQGFNQECIAPAFITPPFTATMDDGTAISFTAAAGFNNGNTWFEQGYYGAQPTYGLPPSGSVFTSASQPTHHYQMGNYSANNALLINSTHVSNNIVPVNPAPFTAFAFLTAGANDNGSPGYMNNECILQHADGVNETNFFRGYDWFNTSVANAWKTFGRVTLDCTPYESAFNNINQSPGQPPFLFETYFNLTDTTSAVTNIIVLYDQAPSGSSTTYIMAVSATAGGVPPVINFGPSPTAQSWFVGQTATISVSVSGTAPITNIWGVETNGSYVALTDGVQWDGSIVSGSSTTTLTISNLQFGDSTNYEYLAENVLDSASGGPVSITVLADSGATPVSIVSQIPPASVPTLTTFPNLPVEVSVTVNAGASPPIGYQWYNGSQTPGNAIPNATNAGYTFSNMNGASLSCVVSNIAGMATSSPVAISATKSPISSPAPYQSALLGYHPVGYWPLNETPGSTVAIDYVGNNNGYYTGNCTLGNAGVAGATELGSSTSVGFDGSSAYVDIPVNNLNITNGISVVAWIQASTAVSLGGVVGHSDASYRMSVDASGDPRFVDSTPDAIGPNAVTDNKWHQLVGVFDGTNEVLYVDGVLAVSELGSGPGSGSLDDVWIGGSPDYGLTRLFIGNIAEVSILTNALTASQVTALYYAAGFVPILVNDVSPLLSEVPAGVPMTFSVDVSGAPPFHYQWSNEDGIISGATNSSYSFDAEAGTNSYYVGIWNSAGSTLSSTAVLIGLTNPPPLITFADSADWALNSDGVYASAPAIVSGELELTDGGGSEGTSAFYDVGQYVGGFIASFNYLPSGGADGVTFCLQNSAKGSNSVGLPGGDLGYTDITPSAAFELNIYTGAVGGVGIQLGTNGSTPDSVNPTGPYLPTGTVNIASGDTIYVQLYYLQGVVQVWLQDLTTLDLFTTSFTVPSLPAVVGNGSAYIGLTGGDGGVTSTQIVTDFTYSYTTSPTLTVAAGATPGTVVVSWPISVSSLFQLLQSSSVTGPWTTAATAAFPTSPDGTQNQVTLSVGGSTSFYQLQLTAPNAP
jgi:hypothetical protein